MRKLRVEGGGRWAEAAQEFGEGAWAGGTEDRDHCSPSEAAWEKRGGVERWGWKGCVVSLGPGVGVGGRGLISCGP